LCEHIAVIVYGYGVLVYGSIEVETIVGRTGAIAYVDVVHRVIVVEVHAIESQRVDVTQGLLRVYAYRLNDCGLLKS
jgi:hypothetical protein